jgi:ABC-type phosphate/phosphonate transport system substrate-binding protein
MGRSTLVTYLGDNATVVAVAIADALSSLGVPVVVHRGDSPTAIEEAVRGDTAQLVWMCGFATVQAIDAGRLSADIIAAPVFPGHEDATYRSVVVVRRDSGARSLDDLVGARLAVNERDSWSGYHALRVHLARGRAR